MNEKYELININDGFENQPKLTKHDEWLISKAIILDNEKILLSLVTPEKNIQKSDLKDVKTFEANLDLLCTAAKHCKKQICQVLIENFNFNPNMFSNDGTPLHWLVRNNFISYSDVENSPNSQQKPTKYQLFKETFECLIRNFCDINAKDSKGFTPLHYASMQDNYGATLLFLNQKNTKKDESENHGMTALHISCKYGCENVANLLIDKLNIDSLRLTDENKMLALHYACACKTEKPSVVKKMIEKFKFILSNENLSEIFLSKKNKYGDTPLNLAVKENHLQIAEILLKHLNLVKCNADNEKNLPVHNAAKTGSIEMLNLLETYNLISFEPNNKWNNVFHIAAYENREQFILSLFNKYESNQKFNDQLNFAINSFNKENFTPLQCAIVKGSIDCVKIFIDRQIKTANIEIKLFELCIEYNQKQVLKYLIEFNKNNLNKFLNGINCSNNTVLHIACIHKNFKLFKLIIENILKNNLPFELILAKNQKDETCFFIACKTGQYEIVEYLLDIRNSKLLCSYDPLNDRDETYSTPLHTTAKNNHLRILELLIENGADVNAKDKFNKTALHYSSEMGCLLVSKVLVEHNSKINSLDIYNKSSLDYSCLVGHNELVKFLLENDAFVHDINDEHYNCLDIAIDHDHKAVVETLINDKNFPKFVYFENEKNSKIKKLITKMPLSMMILLDKCYNSQTRKYDFRLIDNYKYKPTEDHPLWLMAHYQFKYLLAHKTVRKLLELKMAKFPRFIFWANLIFYFIFLILLTFHHVNMSIETSFNDDDDDFISDEMNLTSFNQTNTSASFGKKEKLVHLWPLPFQLTISHHSAKLLFWSFKVYFIVLLIIYVSKKMFQIYNYGIKMLYSIEHWLEIFCFLFNILSLTPNRHLSSAFGAVSVLLGWISFAFFFQSIRVFKLGSYSVALRKTIQNSFKFLPFFFMIYFGFLCSFKIRQNFGVAYFNNTMSQLIKTVTMMVGELQTHNMGLHVNHSIDFFTNNFLYIFFLFIMCIIVLDLFIGIEVGEIKTVIDEAQTQNVAMNLIFVLKVQKVLYEIYAYFKPGLVPQFMNVAEYYSPTCENSLELNKRPDLLNRVENYLITMAHTFDQNINEQIKEICELNEHVENIIKQLDLLKKKLVYVKESNEFGKLSNRNNMRTLSGTSGVVTTYLSAKRKRVGSLNEKRTNIF